LGYDGKLAFDLSRPDGTPRKLLDVSRLRALGFTARMPLRTGIERSYADFLERAAARAVG
jgi:GDP-L-fucose synthase